MGNIDSKYKFEHGNVYLQTDKSYFVAGEQITGKVYLNLSMSYPASSLEIEVKGKEKCKWETRENKEIREGDNVRNEFVDVKHKNDHKIISYKVPVYYFPGGMAPAGQYSFPFSFALPANIPASMFFCGFEKSVASIKYKICAVMEPSIGFNVKKMKFKQTLIIRQPANVGALSPTQTDERNVYACCCFGNKGSARITTQFEKDAYTPDEICRAMCDIDNSNCGGEIRGINISLTQHVELRAKDGRTYNETRVLENKQFDGLGANQSTGGMNRYLELSLSGIKQQARPFDDQKALDKDELYLAERIQPTAKGHTVKLHYTLAVTCDYGSVCAEQPNCTIPLCITPPPLPSYGQVQAPSGWAPVEFNTFQFSLPGPGEVMAAAAQTVAPVSGNINFNVGAGVHEEVKMNVNVPMPGIKLEIDTDRINNDVPIPQPVGAASVQMNIPAPQPAASVQMNVPVPQPVPAAGISVDIREDKQSTNDNVNMNVNFGGMGMPGMNMDMNIEGNMTTNATYTSETKVNGQTTSYTHTSSSNSHDNVPVPVPVPAPVAAPGPVNAQFEMNANMDVHSNSSDEGAQMNANIGMGGMNMNMNFNAGN
jgi:sporulation-control protein spo0M